MRTRHVTVLLLTFLALGAEPAFAFVSEVWGYLSQYQVGIDYSSSFDRVDVTYDMARPVPGGEAQASCTALKDEATRQRCRVEVEGGRSNGWGIFLQQAFRSQGATYFQPDFGFGLRYLEGELTSSNAQLPLERLEFQLVAFVFKPYVTVGITPRSKVPDLLLSLGPLAQIAVGNVRVNDDSERVAVATRSSSVLGGFFELEIVFWRFGEGALSVFTAAEVSSGSGGTRFFPQAVDGMENFRGSFARNIGGSANGFGAKLVAPFP